MAGEFCMKCMHCLVEFHDKAEYSYLGSDVDGIWIVEGYQCAACERNNLYLVNSEGESVEHYPINVKMKTAIYPPGANRPPCPLEVPPEIAADYKEAGRVFPFSPQASAALSRKCLLNLLKDAAQVNAENLEEAIQEAIDAARLPLLLEDLLGSVREVGDFGAYPLKSQQPALIQPVMPAEAEWYLDVLEGLFEFYYVQPAAIAQKKDALNKKLESARICGELLTEP